jgi:hypothetical protein
MLTRSASFYVGLNNNGDRWWHPAALAFLADAGADITEAARIRAAMPGVTR